MIQLRLETAHISLEEVIERNFSKLDIRLGILLNALFFVASCM
jgi:hypothetical protein